MNENNPIEEWLSKINAIGDGTEIIVNIPTRGSHKYLTESDKEAISHLIDATIKLYFQKEELSRLGIII